MSKKGQITTANALPWSEGICLIERLGDDRNFKYQLLITSGIFFGLRISDIKLLRWSHIIGQDEIDIQEIKTGKSRNIPINDDVKSIFLNAFDEVNPVSDEIFLGYKGVLTTQNVNRMLKKFKQDYNLSIERFSTHSLRKCFGRKIWENYGKSYEGLILLMNVFNHTSLKTTMAYLGITQEEINNAYFSLKVA